MSVSILKYVKVDVIEGEHYTQDNFFYLLDLVIKNVYTMDWRRMEGWKDGRNSNSITKTRKTLEMSSICIGLRF